MLEAGFTTVRDLAGPINPLNLEVLALRRAVAIGLVPGSRIFAAGWVGQTGGHSDLPLPDAWPRDESVYADGPWAVRRLVRAEIRLGVDLFKTSASGGAAGHKEELWWRNYTAEELAALVDEAHAVGKRVAVHSHTAEATKRALRAGVDTIEHGTELDEECLALFLETGAFLVPTISIRSERARRDAPPAARPPRSSGSTSTWPRWAISGSGGRPRPGCGWRSAPTPTGRSAITGARTPTSSS